MPARKCPKCGEQFQTREDCVDHMEVRHPIRLLR